MNTGKGMEKSHLEDNLILILDRPVWMYSVLSAFPIQSLMGPLQETQGLEVFCMCDWKWIVWLSRLFEGGDSDANMYQGSGLKEMLEKEYQRRNGGAISWSLEETRVICLPFLLKRGSFF
jgi:hypothetical protein